MNFLTALKKFLLDLLFPIFCLGCGKEGTWLCLDCLKKIPLNKESFCPACNRKTEFGEFCQVCKEAYKIKGVIIASSYKNKLLQNTIQTYKYKFAEELSMPLSQILIEAMLNNKIFYGLQNESFAKNTVLVPVPLHKKRFLWRGFNQAELLAREISKKFNLPILTNILKRKKETEPQTQLNILKRKENIKNAFLCLRPDLVTDKNVILIDDVITTGATLEECARALICGKPREIWGLVLAKG